MVLTNDSDSLLSCGVLSKLFGYKIQHFYTFSALHTADGSGEKAIGVDVDFANGRCWGNHVTMFGDWDVPNKESANLNSIERITRKNYFQKYCGSNLLQQWSYYDLPLPKSEIGKMILLCIDSTFKGYYSPYQNDNISHLHYLRDIMGFEELIYLEQKYNINDFINLMIDLKLNEKIFLSDGKLETKIDTDKLQKELEIDIQLPDQRFEMKQRFQSMGINLYKYPFNSKGEFGKNLVSIALTGKNYVSFTSKIDESKIN